MRLIPLSIMVIMLASIGFAEDPKLSSDDVSVIKETLLHFASKTNYFNWSSTEEPVLLVELWSRKSRESEYNNTNRTDLIIKKTSRCPSSLTYWWGNKRHDLLDGFGEDGKSTHIHPSTLVSMRSRKETDLTELAGLCNIFKISQEGKFFSDRIFVDKHPKAKGWVDVWLPGFNKTNTEAFIGFMFGPRHSPASAFYKLQRTATTDTNWKVTWHKLNYYP